MKIALCYHGIACGKNFKEGGLPVGYSEEFDLMKRNLISHNKNHDFDVFIHSWSKDFESLVVNKMQPKGYCFENSIDFKKETFSFHFKESIKKILGLYSEPKRINNIYSRWYSFYKVCEIASRYKGDYDLVIVTRFDMCLMAPILIDEFSSEYFYSGDWETFYSNDRELLESDYKKSHGMATKMKKGFPYDNEGLQDFFFVSSRDYMLNSFSKIYLELEFLLKKYGPSNHLIALGKLKEDDFSTKHRRKITYFKEYFLSRWI